MKAIKRCKKIKEEKEILSFQISKKIKKEINKIMKKENILCLSELIRNIIDDFLEEYKNGKSE